jgi:hypothetical protein
MNNTTVIDTSPDGPTYEIVDITPDLATQWLRQNTHNRNLRERVVNGYAADMLAGAWVEDGQSIKFSVDGILLDGQHRLAALAQSGVTLRMLIVRDLPDTTQDTMDTGAKRTMADVLKLRGESYAITLAAGLLRVHQWKLGYRKTLKGAGSTHPTHRQLLNVLAEHPELRRSAEIAERVRKPAHLSGSVAALCHWLFVQIDESDCAFFFARLGDGAALLSDDPIYALRRVLENTSREKGRVDETHVTALVIKGWNYFREGRSVQVLTYKPGGASPEKFPEPK